MDMAFNFGVTTMLVNVSLKGRGLEASARPLAPVGVHLQVHRFYDGGLWPVCPPESTDFSLHLGHLVDLGALNDRIPEILSNTRYDDLDTQTFWEEKLTRYAANVGLIAFNAGVEELKLTIEIRIYNMARWLREQPDMAEAVRYSFYREMGRDFVGPASEDSIKMLEVVKYNGVGGEFEENGCSICLEEFEFEMQVTRMPCKHIFHGGCLARWLEKNHHCPLCRYKMSMWCECDE